MTRKKTYNDLISVIKNTELVLIWNEDDFSNNYKRIDTHNIPIKFPCGCVKHDCSLNNIIRSVERNAYKLCNGNYCKKVVDEDKANGFRNCRECGKQYSCINENGNISRTGRVCVDCYNKRNVIVRQSNIKERLKHERYAAKCRYLKKIEMEKTMILILI